VKILELDIDQAKQVYQYERRIQGIEHFIKTYPPKIELFKQQIDLEIQKSLKPEQVVLLCYNMQLDMASHILERDVGAVKKGRQVDLGAR